MSAFGHDLSRSITLCVRCETNRYGYPGKLCGVCWREINGVIAPEPVAVVAPKPAKEPAPPKKRAPRTRYASDKDAERTRYRRQVLGCGPLPQAEVDALWAKRLTTPKPPVVRVCSWPGCDRPHAMHGYCYRDVRRIDKMGANGADPAELPRLWAEYMERLGNVFAANGAAKRGKRWGESYRGVRLDDLAAK